MGNIGLGYFSGYGDGTADQRSVIDNYMTFLGYQASRDASIASTTVLTNGTAIGKNARVAQSNTIILGGTGADAVNVGIGTTSPGSKLSVTSGLSVGANYGVAASGAIIEGNVGIGTTAPGYPLHVNGNIAMSPVAGGNRYLILDATDTGTGQMTLQAGAGSSGYGGSLLLFSHSNPTKPGWVTAGISASSGSGATEGRFTVNDQGLGLGIDVFTVLRTGNVGIGTTSPWRTLSVTGTVGMDGLTGATGAGSLCLDANKQVVYNSASDACLSSTRATKHDIQNLNLDGLSVINQLQPSSFIYNQGDGRLRYGFMAEDTALVDDRLATHNEKGEITGIDDRAIVSVAVKAIKELKLKVDDLQASVAVSGGQTTDSLFSWILSKFSAIGIMFGQDKLGAKKGVFESFEMKDASTGEDYCVKIRNGDWEKIKGTCGETTTVSSSSSSSATSSASSETVSSSSSSSESLSSSSSSSVIESSSSVSSSSSANSSLSEQGSSSSEPTTVVGSSSSSETSSASSESSSSSSSVASSSSVSSETSSASSESSSSSSSVASSSSVSSETSSSSSSVVN